MNAIAVQLSTLLEGARTFARRSLYWYWWATPCTLRQ